MHMYTHKHIEHVDAGANPSWAAATAFGIQFSLGHDKHIQREYCSLHRLQEGGILILIARPVWPISSVDNVDYFKLVQSQGVKAGSQKRSRRSLLQIQGKQMEMRLSQLDSMLGVCVCVGIAKYSYLFPLSIRSEACPHINSVSISLCITKGHLINP